MFSSKGIFFIFGAFRFFLDMLAVIWYRMIEMAAMHCEVMLEAEMTRRKR